MMNEDKVWELIDSINKQADDNRQKGHLLNEKLSQYSDEDIVMFGIIIRHLHYKAETWDLVAVDKIFLNESMMSEDCHYRFNFAVISLGKQRFYDVLNNPDELVYYLPQSVPKLYQDYSFENESYVDGVGFSLKTGKMSFELFDETYKRVYKEWLLQNNNASLGWETHGYKAKSLEELAARLPRIWKRFDTHRDYEELFDLWLNFD